MSKRLYLKNWSAARNKKKFRCHSPETAEKFLRAYLHDEIAVYVGCSFRPRKVKPSAIQILIQSVFIIGQRVILKYCKGEAPHENRIAVWQKGLAICDEFEAEGLLPPPMQMFFEQNGLVFKGRLYVLAEGKCFFVPEAIQSAPCDATDPVSPIWSTVFAGFPPLGKKTAARLLEAYNLKL